VNISQQQLLHSYSTTFKSTCRNYEAPIHHICSCCATQLRSRRFRSKGKLLSSSIILRVCYPVLLRVYFACFDDYHISLSIIHTSLFVFFHYFNHHTVQDEPKGLRGNLEFYKRDGGGGGGGGGRGSGRCYEDCCDYAGEDQVLLGYQKANCDYCGDLDALCDPRGLGGSPRRPGSRYGGRGGRGRGYQAPYYVEESE